MRNITLGLFAAILFSVLVCSCANEVSFRYYSVKSTPSASFGAEDIHEILQMTDSIKETEVNALFQGQKQFDTVIHLNPINEKVAVYRWTKNHEGQQVYYSEDSIKLVIVDMQHAPKVYILRDAKYTSLILALIENETFILNRLNHRSTPRPSMPPVE